MITDIFVNSFIGKYCYMTTTEKQKLERHLLKV